MARGKRGGYQKPANPAESSGVGKLARRTDGSAGTEISEAGGYGYGERKELEETEAGFAGNPAAGAADAARSRPNPGAQIAPLGAPTQRPGESGLAGAAMPGQAPLPAEVVLRRLYAKRPSPYIARLINGGS